MNELTTRQEAFAQQFVITGNGAEAARRAGYAPVGARVTASRLLTKANVQAEIAAERKRYEEGIEVTRERVIAELSSAIDIARTQGNVPAMISGWREIAKICGYYDRKVEVSIHPNVAAQRLVGQLEIMSTDELVKLAESDSN